MASDIWSLDNLIDWIGNQRGTYNYGSCFHCLLAQYFREMGKVDVVVGNNNVTFGFCFNKEIHPLPKGWAEIAGLRIYTSRDRSLPNPVFKFEDAYKRALELKTKIMMEKVDAI